MIRFDVEDTGIGIAPDRQEAVFESFTQADGSTTRKYGGTGLGLTVTKPLVELLGGRLTLTSEEGRGSVFSLTIPVGVDLETQARLDRTKVPDPQSPAPEKTEPVTFSGKVLMAEDVRTNQVLLRTMLDQMGLEVHLAENGEQALQQAMSQSFDLILMDMQMPQMNGYEATRVLRQWGLSTPIVALTANAMRGDDRKCLEAGCDDYLAKPINGRELTRVMAKYLPCSQTTASES
jgi:CheY-like chemotaxis protein